MSTRNTPQRSTCCRLDPAASRMAFTFFKHCSVCCSTPPSTTRPVAGSVAPWPDTNTRRSSCMPGEYGPTGAGRFAARTGECGAFIMTSMSSLRDLLNIRYPIVQSGKGRVAGAGLAAEVSRAGGLGILAGLNVPPAALRAQIRQLRDLCAPAPFGVNLWLHPDLHPPIDPAQLPADEIAAANAALTAARRAVNVPDSSTPPPVRPDFLPQAIDVVLEE